MLNCMTVCNEKQAKTLRERKREIIRNKQKRKREIVSSVIITIILLLILAGSVCKAYNSDYTYWTENGCVTEAICRVVGVSGEIVTVKHRGELYDFNGNGFEVGQSVECKFEHTTEMKLVDVK